MTKDIIANYGTFIFMLEFSIKNLHKKSVPWLKAECKNYKIKNYSKLRKAELVELITNKLNDIQKEDMKKKARKTLQTISLFGLYKKEESDLLIPSLMNKCLKQHRWKKNKATRMYLKSQ